MKAVSRSLHGKRALARVGVATIATFEGVRRKGEWLPLWPQAYFSGEMDFSGLPRNSLVKSLVVRRNRWEKSLGVGSESLPASGEIAVRFSVDFACKLSGAAALSWAADDD